jgi:hypothetical protein
VVGGGAAVPAAPVSVNVFSTAPPPVVSEAAVGFAKPVAMSASTVPISAHTPIVPPVPGAR